MSPDRVRSVSPNLDRQATIRREQTPQVMDEDLKPWTLYNLGGAVRSESTEPINALSQFCTAIDNSCTDDSLQRSWCAFIRRWDVNRREGMSFTYWLEQREGRHGEHAIGDLCHRVYCMTCESGACATPTSARFVQRAKCTDCFHFSRSGRLNARMKSVPISSNVDSYLREKPLGAPSV